MALRCRSTLSLFGQLNPLFGYSHHPSLLLPYNSLCFSSSSCNWNSCFKTQRLLYHRGRKEEVLETTIRRRRRRRRASSGISAALPPLDLTEDNVRQVLADARTVFAQIFDPSIGITGEAELCEVDGPFVKISLRGRFWHERSLVLARLGNYLKQRIPQHKISMGMIYESLAQEILEVDIEDEKQLDDSPENF